MCSAEKKYRVLTCNSHEAYVSMLAYLDVDLDIIDGLSGRYTSQWDRRIRPVPEHARLLTPDQIVKIPGYYDCFIGHGIDDLLLVKNLPSLKF